MVDLSNLTFIIPIRIESDDRLRNVITVLCFLLKTFNSKVIVKEVDQSSIFKEHALPQIEEFLEINPSNLTHVFEYSEDPVFYRMKILNEMIAMSNTDVVVNYDCDVLLPTSTYKMCYDYILNKKYDVIYPYGNGNYQKQIFADDQIVSDFLNSDFDFSILEKKHNIFSSDFGHVQFFNRKSYIEGGMENENFRGSSPEDKERFYRFATLGYNVGRIDDIIYHLEHSRGPNSWPTSMYGNPYMRENQTLWDNIQRMTKDELREYYSSQKYLQKYI